MMLLFASQSEIWIVQNFNFTVSEDFCLSLSWKYRFLQNVNHTKVQSKTNKYCKFHVDLTRRRLSKSRFKKLGMVPKKLYRNTLSCTICHHTPGNETQNRTRELFNLVTPFVMMFVVFSLLDRHHSPLWQSKPGDFSRFSWAGCQNRIIILCENYLAGIYYLFT